MADGSLVRFEIGFTGGGCDLRSSRRRRPEGARGRADQPQRRAARDAGVGGHAPAGAHERGRLAAPARPGQAGGVLGSRRYFGLRRSPQSRMESQFRVDGVGGLRSRRSSSGWRIRRERRRSAVADIGASYGNVSEPCPAATKERRGLSPWSEATAAGEREPEQHSSTVLSEAVPWTEEGYGSSAQRRRSGAPWPQGARAADAALAVVVGASDRLHPSGGPAAHDGPAAKHRPIRPRPLRPRIRPRHQGTSPTERPRRVDRPRPALSRIGSP